MGWSSKAVRSAVNMPTDMGNGPVAIINEPDSQVSSNPMQLSQGDRGQNCDRAHAFSRWQRGISSQTFGQSLQVSNAMIPRLVHTDNRVQALAPSSSTATSASLSSTASAPSVVSSIVPTSVNALSQSQSMDLSTNALPTSVASLPTQYTCNQRVTSPVKDSSISNVTVETCESSGRFNRLYSPRHKSGEPPVEGCACCCCIDTIARGSNVIDSWVIPGSSPQSVQNGTENGSLGLVADRRAMISELTSHMEVALNRHSRELHDLVRRVHSEFLAETVRTIASDLDQHLSCIERELSTQLSKFGTQLEEHLSRVNQDAIMGKCSQQQTTSLSMIPSTDPHISRSSGLVSSDSHRQTMPQRISKTMLNGHSGDVENVGKCDWDMTWEESDDHTEMKSTALVNDGYHSLKSRAENGYPSSKDDSPCLIVLRPVSQEDSGLIGNSQ